MDLGEAEDSASKLEDVEQCLMDETEANQPLAAEPNEAEGWSITDETESHQPLAAEPNETEGLSITDETEAHQPLAAEPNQAEDSSKRRQTVIDSLLDLGEAEDSASKLEDVEQCLMDDTEAHQPLAVEPNEAEGWSITDETEARQLLAAEPNQAEGIVDEEKELEETIRCLEEKRKMLDVELERAKSRLRELRRDKSTGTARQEELGGQKEVLGQTVAMKKQVPKDLQDRALVLKIKGKGFGKSFDQLKRIVLNAKAKSLFMLPGYNDERYMAQNIEDTAWVTFHTKEDLRRGRGVLARSFLGGASLKADNARHNVTMEDIKKMATLEKTNISFQTDAGALKMKSDVRTEKHNDLDSASSLFEVLDVWAITEPEIAEHIRQMVIDRLQAGEISTSHLPMLCGITRSQIQMNTPLDDIEAILNDAIMDVIRDKELKAGAGDGQPASVREPVNTGPSHSKAVMPTAESVIDRCTKPLIGIHLVTRIMREQHGVHDVFECKTCNTSTFNVNSLGPHLMGRTHRLAYLKDKYPDYHKAVLEKYKDKLEQNRMLESYALEIEKQEGRKPMKFKKGEAPAGIKRSAEESGLKEPVAKTSRIEAQINEKNNPLYKTRLCKQGMGPNQVCTRNSCRWRDSNTGTWVWKHPKTELPAMDSLQGHYTEEEEGLFTCKHCNATCIGENTLLNHMRMHPKHLAAKSQGDPNAMPPGSETKNQNAAGRTNKVPKKTEKDPSQLQGDDKPVEVQPGMFRCQLCNMTCSGESSYISHVLGRKHRSAKQELDEPAEGTLAPTSALSKKQRKQFIKDPTECSCCNETFSSEKEAELHYLTKNHRRLQKGYIQAARVGATDLFADGAMILGQRLILGGGQRKIQTVMNEKKVLRHAPKSKDIFQILDVVQIAEPEMAERLKKLINERLRNGQISHSDLPLFVEKIKSHISSRKLLDGIEAMLYDAVEEVIQNK